VTATNIAKSEQIAKAAQTSKGSPAKEAPSPRVRAQAVPTASQIAAFERARARRSGKAEPTLSLTIADSSGPAAGTEPAIGGITVGTFSAAAPGFQRPTKSLTDLAKIATNKRPLTQQSVGKALPKKTMFAVSSGLVAVVILAVLSFEMMRGPNEAEKHMRQAQASAQPFGGSSNVLATSSPEASDEHFTPAPPEQQPAVGQQDTPRPDGPLSEPRAENFDPDSAPANPPPPPILERPGPMEPPSMGSGPPLGMIPENDQQ
jgi:hypothetical protein